MPVAGNVLVPPHLAHIAINGVHDICRTCDDARASRCYNLFHGPQICCLQRRNRAVLIRGDKMQDIDAGDANSRIAAGLRSAAATVGTVVTLANAGQMPEPVTYLAPAVETTSHTQLVETPADDLPDAVDGHRALHDVAASVEQAAEASRQHDAIATETEALPPDPPGIYRDVEADAADLDTDPYVTEIDADPYATEAEGVEGASDIGGPDAAGAGW
jgi:hypothetical protein